MKSISDEPKIQPDIIDEIIGLVRTISGDDNAKFHPDGYANNAIN